MIKELIKHERSIVYIQNITSRAPEAEIRYKVQLQSVAESGIPSVPSSLVGTIGPPP